MYQPNGREIILPNFSPEQSYWIRVLQLMKLCQDTDIDPDVIMKYETIYPDILPEKAPLIWKTGIIKNKLCSCCNHNDHKTSVRLFSPIEPVKILSNPETPVPAGTLSPVTIHQEKIITPVPIQQERITTPISKSPVLVQLERVLTPIPERALTPISIANRTPLIIDSQTPRSFTPISIIGQTPRNGLQETPRFDNAPMLSQLSPQKSPIISEVI
jgi:hypothetical protein